MGVEQSNALAQTEFSFVKTFDLNALSGFNAINTLTKEFGVFFDPG